MFFQAEDGIRDLVRSRGLGDVYKRQAQGYIIVTTKNGFLVIDQHLAHQRILYERYEHATTNAISIQQCLIPQTFELSASDAILLQTLLEELLLLGYHIEPFGHTTFIIPVSYTHLTLPTSDLV